MGENYKCCFCGESMSSGNIEITSLLITSNWNKSVELQQEQQLFCHMKCLNEKMSDKVFLYLSDIID